jgi:hypothetical protein
MGRGVERARRIAISLVVLSLFLLPLTDSFAGVKAGTVTHLSGPLFAKKADGKTWSLSVRSIVEQGDIMMTGKKTYARIRFLDNAEITLRPNTQMKISRFHFEQAEPQKDSAFFDLVKGGARSVVGLIGRRGSQNSYRMVTENATAGVRGTEFGMQDIIREQQIQLNRESEVLPSGTYIFVSEGTISVSNEAGSRDVGPASTHMCGIQHAAVICLKIRGLTSHSSPFPWEDRRERRPGRRWGRLHGALTEDRKSRKGTDRESVPFF